MKKFIGVFAIIAILGIDLYGNEQADSSQVDSALQKHSFQFDLVDQISFSYRRKISAQNYLRLHLDFSGHLGGEENDGQRIYKPTNRVLSENPLRRNKTDQENLFFSVQFLRQLKSKETVSFYSGFGGSFDFSRRAGYSESIYRNSDQQTYYYDSTERALGIGVIGILGLECSISPSISVYGEYQPLFLIGWDKRESENDTDFSTNSGNFWRLSVESFKIGVSINI